MNALGTIGKVINLAHQYAAGSYQVDVKFTMYGLNFRAQRFVRTDVHGPCNSVWLFIYPPDGGFDEYVKTVDVADPCKVGARALHLLAVAEATSVDGIDERFAAIELV